MQDGSNEQEQSKSYLNDKLLLDQLNALIQVIYELDPCWYYGGICVFCDIR